MNSSAEKIPKSNEDSFIGSRISPVQHDIPTSPTVSVIVVNYNGKKFLDECIRSLTAQTYSNLEIIVVDNASSDGSVEYLKSRFQGLLVIENTTNLGFAGGVNTGILNGWGIFIMTLNTDTRIDCHCIERLLTKMIGNESVGMCAAKMLFPDGRINSTGICISRTGAAWDRGMFEEDTGQYDTHEDIIGPCAGAALYRKTMLQEIGFFDEDFFLYMEDVDLACRACLAGWKCSFIPEAVVYHYHGGTTHLMSDLSIYFGNRNILWWPVKNYPLPILLVSVPWIIARTIGVIPYYTSKGKGKIILKSKYDGIAGLPGMWRKRKAIMRMGPRYTINRHFVNWNESLRRWMQTNDNRE